MRDYSASIWAKQEEAIASTSDCSCLYAHVSWWVSCSNGQVRCAAQRAGRASPR